MYHYNASESEWRLNGESSSSCLNCPMDTSLVIAHCGGRPRDSRSFGTMSRSCRLDDGTRLLSARQPCSLRASISSDRCRWICWRAAEPHTRANMTTSHLAPEEEERRWSNLLSSLPSIGGSTARTLRHHRVATSNQNNLAAGIAIGTRLTSTNLVHHAVARRVSHCQCVCSAPRAHRSCRE